MKEWIDGYGIQTIVSATAAHIDTKEQQHNMATEMPAYYSPPQVHPRYRWNHHG